jgi:hypothetical protein
MKLSPFRRLIFKQAPWQIQNTQRFHTILNNGNDQTLFSFAVPPFQEKIDFSKRQ